MRKMKILIGYDGSSCADEAIEDLQNSGLPREADVLVFSAVDVFLAPGREVKIPEPLKVSIQRARAVAKDEVRLAELSAKKAEKRIKSFFPDWQIKHESCADSPAWALVKKADTWKPDLLMVGAHGHSKLGRFMGSVSQMVLTQASCSVRVGRACAHPQRKTLRVLLAIDGSPDSAAAVQFAANRFWPSQTEFLLISVIEHRSPLSIGRTLESAAKKLRNRGATATYEVRKGDPKRILVDEAEAWQANCIFMGARGLTHLKRFFMGGVSTVVAARAHCSVEVVRSR